ncbi:MAG TPA: hypothetical protein VNT25_02330 [Allosphingosinicella sp.]|nr:hypothetical protein [Allosphingosinicella sp.]
MRIPKLLMSLSMAIAPAAVSAQAPFILPTDPRYSAASEYLKRIVTDSLRDAESARMGQVIVCSYTPDLKVGIVRVNAKNAYGGYTGYKTFVAFDNSEIRQALSVKENPYGAEEFTEQRAILSLLKACAPVVKAYDETRASSDE